MAGEQELRAEAQRSSHLRSILLDLAAAELVKALDAAGVRSILLKGPVLGRWLWEGEGRAYTDVDLLIEPAQFAAAAEVAESLGYRWLKMESTRHDRDGHHEVFLRDQPPAKLELHRNLAGVDATDERAWSVLAGATERFDLGIDGVSVDALQPAPLALLVALHAASHGADYPPPLRDLERAIERVPTETWAHAAQLARELDATDAAARGLQLVDGGRALAEAVGLRASYSVEGALLAMSPAPTAVGIDRLLRTRGLRGKAALLAREVVPPADYLRAAHPLARRGPVGLAAAYLVRPFWLARHAVGGVRAWRKAAQHERERAGAPPA